MQKNEKKISNTALLFFKGLAMGTCDVIPGVSGGTIAFITGIYDRLLDALNHINKTSIHLFFTGQRKKFRTYIDGWFLSTLIGGIFIAIISLAKTMDYLLANHPVLVRSFFFWLILASALILTKTVSTRKIKTISALVIGTTIWFAITSLPLIQTSDQPWFTFFAGMLAITAMILPGISGSYILLILNKYQFIISTLVQFIDGIKEATSLLIAGDTSAARETVVTLPYTTIILFVAGAVIGLILFAKILHRIKNNYHDIMIATLTGFMIGSLNKVRPRRETIQTYIDRHGEIQPIIQTNIIPNTTNDALSGIVFMAIGFSIVFIINILADRLTKTK